MTDDLACVIHVHSTYSDGTASVPEILSAARAAGADAVLLTDHDSLGALGDGWEGWHDGVLLIVGTEVSTRDGHLLAFGIEHEIDHRGLSERQIATAVRHAGGLAIPAHPFSRGSRISRRIGRPHPWSDLEDGPIDGIEVWSLLTEAAEACRGIRELVGFARRPGEAARELPAANLEAWDRLGARRRLVGIGGLDAHQTGVRLPGGYVLSPFAHERIFRQLRTHVLIDGERSGDGVSDRDAVLAAVAAGHCYLAVDAVAPAAGFTFGEPEPGLVMGDEAPAASQVLAARTPEPADIRLLCDGRQVARSHGRELEYRAAGPGVHRVEVRVDGRPWIVSNPIYLR